MYLHGWITDDDMNDCIPRKPFHEPIVRLQRPCTCLEASDYAKAVALSTFEHLFDRKDAPAFTPCGEGI